MMNQSLPIEMTKGEKITGLVYIPIYVFFLGSALYLLLPVLGIEATALTANIAYFYFNFIFVAVVFRKYLTASLTYFLKNLSRSLMWTVICFGIYLAMNIVLNLALTAAFGEVTNPNNDYVGSLYEQSGKAIIVGAVLLGPLVEEVLFRGVIFGLIHRKNRALAYIVTVLAFTFIHIWAYALEAPDWSLLVTALQYIPPTVAFCLCYEKTGSIFCPILLHAVVNALALFAMTLMP